MLVLTRRIGEQIIIDGTIRITVVDIRGDKVRIGIQAPDDVRVDRAEVHQRRLEFGLASEETLVPQVISTVRGN
jgi:carbon storage regulator